MKTCKSCKNLFKPLRNTSLYCSRYCYIKSHSKNTKDCTCKNCNKEFKTEKNKLDNGRGIYCSRLCADKGKRFLRNRIQRKCQICNKEFEILPLRVKKYEWGNYCSLKCSGKSKQKRIETICKVCKNKFETSLYRIEKGEVFCSMKCSRLGRRKREKDLSKRIIEKCLYCQNTFSRTLSDPQKFCSKKCYTEHQTDLIKNGNYIPYYGHTLKGYYTSKINKENHYYDSSYELIRMNQLDNMNVIWTKKHGIKIKYIDKKGIQRYYIPDFLVENKIIEEIKPFKLLDKYNNQEKIKAAYDFCNGNNLQYRIITEKDLGI